MCNSLDCTGEGRDSRELFYSYHIARMAPAPPNVLRVPLEGMYQVTLLHVDAYLDRLELVEHD